MTPDEVVKLLVRVQADDNRDVGQVTVASWQQVVGDLDFQDALEAVVAHRRTRPDTWLLPGHVVQGVNLLRARRRAAVERQQSIERQKAISTSVPSDDVYAKPANFDELTQQWAEYYKQHPEER